MARRYWFHSRKAGSGITPATWEGWALVVGLVIVALGGVWLISHFVPFPPGPWRFFGPLAFVLPLLALFLWITDRHTGGD
jgi:hypothetical protein